MCDIMIDLAHDEVCFIHKGVLYIVAFGLRFTNRPNTSIAASKELAVKLAEGTARQLAGLK